MNFQFTILFICLFSAQTFSAQLELRPNMPQMLHHFVQHVVKQPVSLLSLVFGRLKRQIKLEEEKIEVPNSPQKKLI